MKPQKPASKPIKINTITANKFNNFHKFHRRFRFQTAGATRPKAPVFIGNKGKYTARNPGDSLRR
jgi:hypothetical protein